MPKFKFTEKELTLINLASRGLVQTVSSSKFIKSALEMSKVQPKAIDEAIKIAIRSAFQVSKEEANKRWKIVVVLCNLKWKDHRPSQEIVNWALELATAKAVETNNWEFVIALCNLAAPARQPSKKIINSILEIVLSKAQRYENKGAIQSSSKTWEAVKAIASLQPPATEPDKNLSNDALEQLAKVPQKRVDKKFMNLAQNGEWVRVLNYFIQDQQGKNKPSQMAINFVLIATASDNQWKVLRALCNFQQPDPKTAGSLLQVAAGKGNLEVVQLLCNLDEQNIPNLYYLKNALQVAKNAGHSEIASYLSFEIVRQTHSKEPLVLTQAILQDYVNHTYAGSSLFSGQIRAVKAILSQVKRTAAQEEGEDARNQVAIDAVKNLQAIMGSNQDLSSRVNYINTHCCKKDEVLDSSLIAML